MAEDLDDDALELIEECLAQLPSDPGLPDELTVEFRRRRARIHQRHNEWRRGMPAIDELFDDDAHRAKALAGSLSTELERTLELRGEMAPSPDSSSGWPGQFAAEWCERATQVARCWGWDAEANEMFDLVLQDLSSQAVRRAEAGERPLSARPEVHISRLRRLGIMGMRTVGRFFRPPPARH